MVGIKSFLFPILADPVNKRLKHEDKPLSGPLNTEADGREKNDKFSGRFTVSKERHPRPVFQLTDFCLMLRIS